MDLCEFEASLVYRVSSRTAKAAQRNPVSKKPKTVWKHTHQQRPSLRTEFQEQNWTRQEKTYHTLLRTNQLADGEHLAREQSQDLADCKFRKSANLRISERHLQVHQERESKN